jgi:hypothetical protein
MSVRTSDYPPKPLPGALIINLVLAAAIWGIGVALTAQSLPIRDQGPIMPWVAAGALQALLSAAQSNIRVVGLRLDVWGLGLLVLVDVALNMFGLLQVYVPLKGLDEVWLYLGRAFLAGVGTWQCVAAFVVGSLIAVVPEQLVRSALHKGGAA